MAVQRNSFEATACRHARLPSALPLNTLFAIRTLSIHQKLCGDKQALFKLSDAKAIRLAYVIGSVKENFTQKIYIIYLPWCISNQNTKKLFFVHTMKVSVVWLLDIIFYLLQKKESYKCEKIIAHFLILGNLVKFWILSSKNPTFFYVTNIWIIQITFFHYKELFVQSRFHEC